MVAAQPLLAQKSSAIYCCHSCDHSHNYGFIKDNDQLTAGTPNNSQVVAYRASIGL